MQSRDVILATLFDSTTVVGLRTMLSALRGIYDDPTSNRAELRAAIAAWERNNYLCEGFSRFLLGSDSKYL